MAEFASVDDHRRGARGGRGDVEAVASGRLLDAVQREVASLLHAAHPDVACSVFGERECGHGGGLGPRRCRVARHAEAAELSVRVLALGVSVGAARTASAVAEADFHVVPAGRGRDGARHADVVPRRVLEYLRAVDRHPGRVVHGLGEVVRAAVEVHLPMVAPGAVVRPDWRIRLVAVGGRLDAARLDRREYADVRDAHGRVVVAVVGVDETALEAGAVDGRLRGNRRSGEDEDGGELVFHGVVGVGMGWLNPRKILVA